MKLTRSEYVLPAATTDRIWPVFGLGVDLVSKLVNEKLRSNQLGRTSSWP